MFGLDNLKLFFDLMFFFLYFSFKKKWKSVKCIEYNEEYMIFKLRMDGIEIFNYLKFYANCFFLFVCLIFIYFIEICIKV